MMKRGFHLHDRRVVLELDGGYRLLLGGESRTLRNLEEVRGEKWLVTDFGGKTITQTLTLDAPLKSVEVFVRKKIQEEGEFDEPAHVITHWKHARSSRSTDIFFTAVPLSVFHRYQELVQESADNILLVPLFSMLHRILVSTPSGKREGTALLFAHGRYLDILVERHQRIVHASRLTAYSGEEEGIKALWEMAEQELDQLIRRGMAFEAVRVLDWVPESVRPLEAADGGRWG